MAQTMEDTRSSPTVATHTLALVLTTTFSLVGNWLVCLAFYRNRRLRTITNYYVLFLAVNDIVVATFAYPFATIASALRKWPFGFYVCQFDGFLSYFWGILSIGILAATAVNRYFCIVKPWYYPTLFTKKRTVHSIIFVLMFTFATYFTAVLSSSFSFRWHFQYLLCEITDIKFQTDKVIIYFMTTVVVAVPMCIIVFCYGSVYRAIWRHNAAVAPFLGKANSHGIVRSHEIQASRVLLVAVIAFFICWMPAAIIINLEKVALVNVPPFWQFLHSVAAICSTWINPVIYGVMNRSMRNEFKNMLCCRNGNRLLRRTKGLHNTNDPLFAQPAAWPCSPKT